MQSSESIKNIAAALCKLQGEIIDAPSNAKGHNHEYADLNAMLKIARPLLAKNGLALSQLIGTAEDMVTVESVLMHESGEYISSTISVPSGASGKMMNALQAIGSSVSYARRYALAALLNFTKNGDDDDGQSVNAVKYMPQPNKPISLTACINESQVIELIMLIKQAGKDKDKLLDYYKIDKIEQFPLNSFEGQCNQLKRTIEKNKLGTV